MFRTQAKRVRQALFNAACLRESRAGWLRQSGRAHQISTRLRRRHIVHEKHGIVVTEAGFVTMAIFPDCGVEGSGMLAVPGIDDEGQRGHLVLRIGLPPYHSMELDPTLAIAEAVGAAAKSDALLAAFGDKDTLCSAVKNAPFWLPSTVEDFERSGLCLWGAESFLKRLGMLRIARTFGLPRFLLKWAGPYGVRLTAAALLRRGMWRLDEGQTQKTV